MVHKQSLKGAFSMKLPFYAFALLILLAFSAFSCEECEEITCEIPICTEITSVDVFANEVLCGTGVWNNIWFSESSTTIPPELYCGDNPERNQYLQPFSLSDELTKELATKNYAIQPSAKYRITYQPAILDNRYDHVVICEAYVGKKMPIHILSIELLEESNQ